MNKILDNYEIIITTDNNIITLNIYDKINNKTCKKLFTKKKISIIPLDIMLSIDEIYDCCITTKTTDITINKISDMLHIIFKNENLQITFEIYNSEFYDLQQENINNKLDEIQKKILNIKKYEINLIPNINLNHIIIAYIALNSFERILKIIYK